MNPNQDDNLDITLNVVQAPAIQLILSGTSVGTAGTLALSNNSATPVINTDIYRTVHITAQTVAIASFTSGLAGTPIDGDTLHISITGTGAVGLTWGSSFEASTVSLPTTTMGTNRLDVILTWNTESGRWRCMMVA